jgi:hypothetical protein
MHQSQDTANGFGRIGILRFYKNLPSIGTTYSAPSRKGFTRHGTNGTRGYPPHNGIVQPIHLVRRDGRVGQIPYRLVHDTHGIVVDVVINGIGIRNGGY